MQEYLEQFQFESDLLQPRTTNAERNCRRARTQLL